MAVTRFELRSSRSKVGNLDPPNFRFTQFNKQRFATNWGGGAPPTQYFDLCSSLSSLQFFSEISILRSCTLRWRSRLLCSTVERSWTTKPSSKLGSTLPPSEKLSFKKIRLERFVLYNKYGLYTTTTYARTF